MAFFDVLTTVMGVALTGFSLCLVARHIYSIRYRRRVFALSEKLQAVQRDLRRNRSRTSRLRRRATEREYGELWDTLGYCEPRFPEPAMEGGKPMGPVIYFANNPHNLPDMEYRFSFERTDSGWRAYILRMPSLQGRQESGVITHRLWDGARDYVCWDTPIYNLKDMQTIARVWADNIQEYIATGRRFGPDAN